MSRRLAAFDGFRSGLVSSGGRVELGGPEALGIDAWARRLFAATGDNRTVIADPHARYYGTELQDGKWARNDGMYDLTPDD